MEDEIPEEIKNYAQALLTARYGYCGVSIGGKTDNSYQFAKLNSDNGKGNDIEITIESKEE